ncbi:flagellar hook-associated family protein [Afifella pfennigii]|uniref:flagellar hook-associated family protein n=1 Tax=Afifella pfennigii TaxID=209897 RepID=UPI00047D6822|nr:flagellar hook-associated family protein [Afifella pfennigii]
MKTTFVSTYALASNLRASLPTLQAQISKVGTEVSTARHADMGLELGTQTGRTLTLRHELSALKGHLDTNAIVAGRLSRTQVTLDSLLAGANSFLQEVVSAQDASQTVAQLQQSARDGLNGFLQMANSVAGEQYLLGGINSGTRPLADYQGAPKAALDNAFATAFGIAMPNPQDDPAVASITPAAMTAFLENDFAALFDDPAWTTDWSSASSTDTQVRISPEERISISANANDPALRKLAMAYSMVADLGAGKLPAATLDVVVAKASEALGEAVFHLGHMQSRIGFAEARLEAATQRMQTEEDVITRNIDVLEGVDPIEAKVRFDSLTTQLEMSYALTSRILKLSMINYA